MIARAGELPVGLLNLVVIADGLVEASLLVADAWQRQGVASWLLMTTLGQTQWAGWTVRAIVQPDNWAVRQLLRHQQGGRSRLAGTDPGQLHVDIVLPGVRPGPR